MTNAQSKTEIQPLKWGHLQNRGRERKKKEEKKTHEFGADAWLLDVLHFENDPEAFCLTQKKSKKRQKRERDRVQSRETKNEPVVA